jgi:hypothetical protein
MGFGGFRRREDVSDPEGEGAVFDLAPKPIEEGVSRPGRRRHDG